MSQEKVDLSLVIQGKEWEGFISFIKPRIPLFIDEFRNGFSERCMEIIGLGKNAEGVTDDHRALFIYSFVKKRFGELDISNISEDVLALSGPIKSTPMEDIVFRSCYDAVSHGTDALNYDGIRFGAPGLGVHAKFTRNGREGSSFTIDPNREIMTDTFRKFERYLRRYYSVLGIPYNRNGVKNF